MHYEDVPLPAGVRLRGSLKDLRSRTYLKLLGDQGRIVLFELTKHVQNVFLLADSHPGDSVKAPRQSK